jgi:hypothetical protein
LKKIKTIETASLPEMITFLANGSDVLRNPNVNSNSSLGQDGAGQVTVSGGQSIFPDDYIIEFEVDSTLPNGEFDGSTGFIGIRVYESQAAFNAGEPTFTYTPQNPGQTGNIQNSLSGIGDSYVSFNAGVLVTNQSGAPQLQSLFVAPGSDIGLNGSTTFDRNTDNDFNDDGSIDGNSVEDGNGFFNVASSQTVCFTTQTKILTPNGECSIEDLRRGDMVMTADNGPKPLLWIGKRDLGRAQLVCSPRLRPILIPEGVYGAQRATFVSRQHAVVDECGGLVSAIKLARRKKSGVRVANGVRKVTYIHLMCENHEVIFGNGIATESFFPGPQALKMMSRKQRAEVFELFPALRPKEVSTVSQSWAYGPKARAVLSC